MKLTATKLLDFYETKCAAYLFLVLGAVATTVYWTHDFHPLSYFSFSFKLLLLLPLMVLLFVASSVIAAALLWVVCMVITYVWRMTQDFHWALRVPMVIGLVLVWFIMNGGSGDS